MKQYFSSAFNTFGQCEHYLALYALRK